jgi:hypothetical protein
VAVEESRVDAIVRVVDPAYLRTTAHADVASLALTLLPGLVRHRCECGSAHGIEAELADTETPHLLEHVALELAALAGSPRTLRGETSWDFSRDGRGVFRISLAYDDDRVMLGALSAAVEVVDACLGLRVAPDIESVVAELRHGRTKNSGGV